MILCSVSIGLSLLFPWLKNAPIIFFILGLLGALIGGIFAFKEMLLSLKQVEYEHERVGSLKL